MNVLVTGGTGFLGQHLLPVLVNHNYRVFAAGRNFSQLSTTTVTQVKLDLRNREQVIAACKGMDAVVHAGALSSPWGKRDEFFATNLGGTQAIIEGCHLYNVRRLVHISSPSVIFDGRDHVNITESHPYPRNFMSTYALTKKLAEDAVNAAFPNAIILRPKAIFGPGDQALLPRLIAAARHSRLRIFGDGLNQIDLTYVDNVVHAIRLALQAPSVSGTYTITNDEHVPLWDVIRTVMAHLGLSTKLRRVPLPIGLAMAGLMEGWSTITKKEPLLTRYSVALLACTQTYDISAAKDQLGYEPIISIATGIKRTLQHLT
jgi:nucleoside-diphosphate-sugar epimerase